MNEKALISVDFIRTYGAGTLCTTYVTELNGFVKELNMFHHYEAEKITHKASDVAENLQLYRVVRFFCLRSLCTTMHLKESGHRWKKLYNQ